MESSLSLLAQLSTAAGTPPSPNQDPMASMKYLNFKFRRILGQLIPGHKEEHTEILMHERFKYIHLALYHGFIRC